MTRVRRWSQSISLAVMATRVRNAVRKSVFSAKRRPYLPRYSNRQTCRGTIYGQSVSVFEDIAITGWKCIVEQVEWTSARRRNT
jgi:hypothetical protein